MLLTRLKDLGAVLDDALVDSADTRRRGVAEDDRRIVAAPPVKLADVVDLSGLRDDLRYRQSQVAQVPGAKRGGNVTRRIRLRLSVPGYTAADSSRLEMDLAQPVRARPACPSRLPRRVRL